MILIRLSDEIFYRLQPSLGEGRAGEDDIIKVRNL
jgi:hypothetical protein